MKNKTVVHLKTLFITLSILISCETEEEGNPIDQNAGDNTPSTHYPGESKQSLFWVNGGVSGPGKGRDVTVSSSVFQVPAVKEGDTYRTDLGLEGKTIMGFLGANYNQDGSRPDRGPDMPLVRWNYNPEFNHLYDRNYVATSFVFVDSLEKANATIIINEPFLLENRGLNIWRDNYMEVIRGTVTIEVLDKNKGDTIPPLGIKPDGTPNEFFTFEASEITARDYGNISSDFGEIEPDVNMIDVMAKFSRSGNQLFVQVIETIIEHGDSLDIVQPPKIN